MLKNLTRLEANVNGRVGHFYCDFDTPLPEVKEMLFQFQKFVGQVEDSARQQQEMEKQVQITDIPEVNSVSEEHA